MSTQRNVTWCVALAVGVTLATATAINWPEIQREYYKMRLRADSSRLREMLLSGSPAKQAAAREFAREPRGTEAAISLLLTLDQGDIEIKKRMKDPSTPGGAFSFSRGATYWEIWNLREGQSRLHVVLRAQDDALIPPLLEAIEESAGSTFRPMGDLRGLEIHVEKVEEEEEEEGGTVRLWQIDPGGQFMPSVPPGAVVVCYFKRIAP